MQDPDAGASVEYSGTGKEARVAGEREQQGGWMARDEVSEVAWGHPKDLHCFFGREPIHFLTH